MRTQECYQNQCLDVPLREHILLASASSNFDLSPASSKRLILHYEKSYSPHETLKGFRGDYYWQDGSLRFYLKSPELWQFGLLASNFCQSVPFVYYSSVEGEKTPPRYFISAAEHKIEAFLEPVRSRLLQMVATGRGIVPPVATLAGLYI